MDLEPKSKKSKKFGKHKEDWIKISILFFKNFNLNQLTKWSKFSQIFQPKKSSKESPEKEALYILKTIFSFFEIR